MNSFDAFKLYISLKNHFSRPSYDYFKYNGKTNLKIETFQKRKDKIFFEKLAKHKDLHNFLLANFVENSKLWVRDLAYSEEAENTYNKWIKKNQSLKYQFEQELSKLENNQLDSLLIVQNNQHPILLKSYLTGYEISIETLCILLDLTGAKKHWDKELQYDPVWDMLSEKVKKYTPFIKYDKDKFKEVCLNNFTK